MWGENIRVREAWALGEEVDPWGQPFAYRSLRPLFGASVAYSLGPNRQDDTAEALQAWLDGGVDHVNSVPQPLLGDDIPLPSEYYALTEELWLFHWSRPAFWFAALLLSWIYFGARQWRLPRTNKVWVETGRAALPALPVGVLLGAGLLWLGLGEAPLPATVVHKNAGIVGTCCLLSLLAFLFWRSKRQESAPEAESDSSASL